MPTHSLDLATPRAMLLSDLVFGVLFLSPLNIKLNLNAKLIKMLFMTKSICSIICKIRQIGLLLSDFQSEKDYYFSL